MYEEAMHIPYLIRYPKEIEPGTINEDFIMNIDFAPTFLDFAGAEIPTEIQGVSFRPLLKGKTPNDWRKSVYYRFYDKYTQPQYGIRTESHKLIYFPSIDEYELFDLEEDPKEMKNIIDEENYVELAKELKIELKQIKEKYKDFE